MTIKFFTNFNFCLEWCFSITQIMWEKYFHQSAYILTSEDNIVSLDTE